MNPSIPSGCLARVGSHPARNRARAAIPKLIIGTPRRNRAAGDQMSSKEDTREGRLRRREVLGRCGVLLRRMLMNVLLKAQTGGPH